MPYVVNQVHRNGARKKSQWRISIPDEVWCFEHSVSRSWVVGSEAWGLHNPEGHPRYLGVAQDHMTEVFIAKFIGDNDIWHGYPADHQRNPQDIPHPTVMASWLELELIR